MNKQLKLNLLIDICMFILLLGCMSYSLIGIKIHEYIGIALCILFIIHCFNHQKYYYSLFHFRFDLQKIIFFIINLGTLISMLGLIISSLIFLDYIPNIYDINLINFARIMHLLSAYWGFCFISLHCGLHWKMIYNLILKKLPIAINKILQAFPKISLILSLIIAFYGLNSFLHYDLLSYMFYQNNFVFFDPTQSLLLFILDYISISGLFITLAHYGLKLIPISDFKFCLKKDNIHIS